LRQLKRFIRVETVAVLVVVWLVAALALGLAKHAGAVPTAGLMALGLVLGGVVMVLWHSLVVAGRIDHLYRESRVTHRTVVSVKDDLKQTYRQLEALQTLNTMLPTTEVLPATRGWAASPDLLLALVDLAITQRPALVVECGSGSSTLWLALTMRKFGINGRVVALDHEPVFRGKTRDLLARHGVSDLAEVRDAPLESFTVDGANYQWYAKKAWEDLEGIDLLFVDGPPATTGDKARFPALPLLRDSLSPAATLVLDDLIVPDMQETLRLWTAANPEFTSEILPLEKKAAVLRRA
jgi:predicted O-methyltransferase YrrM